jgi:thymidylate synthase (FAD)
MIVKLIGATASFIPGVDSNDLVAYCARVSNPDNQMNMQTSEKLLAYLLQHKHVSPYEMVNVLMEIETTRDIARQILRHRSFAFQEFSQRYAVATNFETREARLQDKKNRQNSIELGVGGFTTERENDLIAIWEEGQNEIIALSKHYYNWAIQSGIAKEQARAVLPEGMTLSRMYMNGTLRSWIHYCALRTGPETQKEHREVAQACWDNILVNYPVLRHLDLAGVRG